MNQFRSTKNNGLLLAVAASLSLSDTTMAAELPVPSAEYPTIEAAVDAAQPGDTVRIAAGDYYEQLLINNKTGLTLRGEQGAVIHATTGMGQTLQPWTTLPAVVGIVQSRDVALVGLTIDGDRLGGAYSPGSPIIGDGLQGVFYLGSSGSVRDCTIRGFRGASLDAPGDARALVVWNGGSAGTNSIEVNIISNRFDDNEQSISLAGDDEFNPTQLRTTFTIEGNTITGFGPAATAASGVMIYTGAGGIIRGNTFSGHQYTGTGNTATGISGYDGLAASRNPPQWMPLRPIRFEGNTFRNNDDHLFLLNAPNSAVVNNTFEGSGPSEPWWGALAISGANIRVENNDFANLPTGIHLFGEDQLLPGLPPTRPASNPILIANCFSNVSNPVHIQPGVTNLQQLGTRLAPVQPEFKSFVRTGTDQSQSLTLIVRSWHGVPITLESSTNLHDWTTVATNAVPLPSFEFTHPTSAEIRQQFYRLRSGN